MVVALPILIVTAALQVACISSDITVDEAKALAIHVGAVSATHPDELDAEESDATGSADVWTFRVFSRHVETYEQSSLVGWFSVNKRTASLTDPVLDDEPYSIPQVAEEQATLRTAHCLNEQ